MSSDTFLLLYIPGNNTNNLVERQFRVMKETVLRRSIAFNCVSLAEKIAIVYNMWSITRLLDAAHGKLADVHLLYDQRLSMYNLATGNQGWKCREGYAITMEV